jgi:hypothetical protein
MDSRAAEFRHMIKHIAWARFSHLSLIVIGILVFLAYLGSGSRAEVAGAIPAQQTLPVVGFTTAVFNVLENQSPAVISVSINRAPDAGQDVIVEYLTLPGTAQEGQGGDYLRAAGTLTFTSSTQTTQSFNITIINNTIVNEPDKTVNLLLRLNTPNTATLGRSEAVLFIIDDDIATATPRPTGATGTPIFVDIAEPNNTFEQAYAVQPGANAICQLTLWPPGDLDFYSFAVKAGTFYKVETSDLSPGLDTVLRVYNQRGDVIAENDDSGLPGEFQSEVVVRADVTGVYFARVVNKSPADPANKTYCFEITAMEQPTPTATATLMATRVGADACEPNGQLHLACLFGANQSQQFNFVPPFNEGPDQDFYKIWVVPGMTITCETTDLSAVTDTNMIFLGPNGEDFNPPLGNDNKAPGDLGSRLTYTSNYTGYLHVLVGPVNPVPLAQAAQFTYTLACVSTFAPTATPTLAFVAPPPGTGVTVPSQPTITPFPSPTTDDFSTLLTPSPIVIPQVTIQPLPTATPAVGAQTTATVNITVFYDSNFNFTPEENEGIIDVAVALFDNTNGRLIAFGYTNQAGSVRFDSIPTTGSVRVEVPLLNYQQIVGPGESNISVRVAPLPLPIGIP